MENCVFCDKKNFGDLFIGESNGWHLAATLGQIVGGYVLLIPKEHVSCLGDLTSEQTRVMVDLIDRVKTAICSEYAGPVLRFEHGIVGQTVKHAHLHLMPFDVDITSIIREDFPAYEIYEVQSIEYVHSLFFRSPKPYLFWTTPRGKSMLCWNPPAPSQYLRLITARLAGRPERGNWRTMDPKLDREIGLETVRRLKPYFKEA